MNLKINKLPMDEIAQINGEMKEEALRQINPQINSVYINLEKREISADIRKSQERG